MMKQEQRPLTDTDLQYLLSITDSADVVIAFWRLFIGAERWDTGNNPSQPADYAIPKRQWLELCKAGGVTWVNAGPSAYDVPEADEREALGLISEQDQSRCTFQNCSVNGIPFGN